MRVSSLFWCIFFAKCLERIIICCIFALEKLKFNVLTPKTRKGTEKMKTNNITKETAEKKYVGCIFEQTIGYHKGEKFECTGIYEERGRLYYCASWECGAYTFEEMDGEKFKIVGHTPEIPAEVVENESENTTVYRHTTAEKVASIARTIAKAVGICYGSNFPACDMEEDLKRFSRWQHGESTPVIMDASAAFFFAVRKQGSESGRVSYVRERCKHLGAPVYVLKVEREEIAGLYTLKVRVSSPATGESVADAWEARKDENDSTESEGSAQRLASVAADYMAGTLDSVKRYAKKAKETAAAAFFRLVGALLIALQFVGGIAAICGAGFLMGLIFPAAHGSIFTVILSAACILALSMGAAYVLVRMTQKINKASNYRLLPYNY